jgi:hypothetical protein
MKILSPVEGREIPIGDFEEIYRLAVRWVDRKEKRK